MPPYQEIQPGRVFTRYVVLEPPFADYRHKNRQYFCKVQCTCGTIKEVLIKNLVKGKVKSCGCLRQEMLTTGAVHFTHGMATKGNPHRLYGIWCAMKQRCLCPTNRTYKRYGGRGINIAKEWQDSFKAFFIWAISAGYRSGLSIERIDVNGDYSPENCTFIPLKLQARNTRKTRWVTCFGETKSLASWAEDDRCLVKYATVQARLNKGWEPEKALTTPTRQT
jgi:hypothetical protein